MFNLHRVPLLTTTAALVIALVVRMSSVLVRDMLVLPDSVTGAQSTSCTNATFAVKLRNCTFESGVTSWGNLIEVGTPPQRLCLVPSTVLNSTLVSQESLCLVSQTLEAHKCEALRGGFFNENSSSTWTDVSLVKYNDTRSNPTWEHFNPPGFTKVGYDKIVFPNTDPPVDLYGAGIALNQYGNNSNAGMIGLGINSVFLNDAVRQGRAGSKSWSLDSGSNSLVKPREGEMVIGGYNSARTDGSFSWSNVSNMAGDRPCPLRTRITEMSVTLGDGSIVPIISSAETAEACIEPYDNLFRFTPGMLFNWKSITKFNETLLQVYTSETANNNLSFTELGLPYDSAKVDDNWQLSITLDNGYKTTLPSFELQRPLLGFDNFGNKDAVPGITNLQILNVPTGEGEVPTLGKIFLSRSYLAVNYETSQFGLALAAIDPATDKYVSFPSKACSSNSSSPDPNAPNDSSSSSSDSKPPLGAIIGGSVGGFVLLIVLVIAAIFCVRKRRRERRKREASQSFGFGGIRRPSERATYAPETWPRHGRNNSFMSGERDSPRTAYSDMGTPGSGHTGWPPGAGRPLYEVPG
ncbi:hypothetical protein V8F33_002234 [Rhypophila sp. PSN 637]